MDKELRKMIAEAVSETIVRVTTERYELYNERYLTAEQLCEQFGMFSKDWLARHGHLLPREHVVIEDTDGKKHGTRWAYPQHRIARMIQDGCFR